LDHKDLLDPRVNKETSDIRDSLGLRVNKVLTGHRGIRDFKGTLDSRVHRDSKA
jgi:hypothetical protein